MRAPGLSQEASPGAGPVLAGETLVYMGGGGFFTAYGLNAKTGKTEWSLNKRSAALAAGPSAVFLGTEGGLGVAAVDAQTGKIRWERRAVKVGGSVTKMAYSRGRLYTDSRWVWDTNAGRVVAKLPADPAAVSAMSGRVFLLGDNIPLIALAPRTSKTLWEQRNPLPPSRNHADDFLGASVHYLAAAFYDGNSFEAHRGLLAVYDAANGRLLWTKTITSSAGLLPNPVSAGDKFVYLIEPGREKGTGATVTAFDGKVGRLVWSFTAKRLNGPAAPVGDVVLVSSDQGPAPEYTTLYALDRETGALRWKFSFQVSARRVKEIPSQASRANGGRHPSAALVEPGRRKPALLAPGGE